MPLRCLPLMLLLCLPPAPAQAQTAPPAASVPAAATASADGEGAGKDFRDTRAYDFPALSRTLRDMQNLATAMQLRDYCADDRVPDAFVKAQLERFSRITGRKEDCRTLVDY